MTRLKSTPLGNYIVGVESSLPIFLQRSIHLKQKVSIISKVVFEISTAVKKKPVTISPGFSINAGSH